VKDLKIASPTLERWGFQMLDFTWKVFLQTGNVDTYLLFKELEKEYLEIPGSQDEELAEFDFPIM
jgi:YqzL-like protein